MERPLELQFVARQALWIGIYKDVLNYVIDQSIRAENGLLDGEGVEDEYTGEIQYVLKATKPADATEAAATIEDETAEPIPRTVSITFPPLLEHDIVQTVAALISGATLDGKPLAGTIDMKTLTREVFKALKIENAEELIEKMYPGEDLVMQTTYAKQAQDNAAAQALALAQQPRQGSPIGTFPQPPGQNDIPPEEEAARLKARPLVVEDTQAYQETQAALIAARKTFVDAIMKGLEEHYKAET
jgi:hypothetical protein